MLSKQHGNARGFMIRLRHGRHIPLFNQFPTRHAKSVPVIGELVFLSLLISKIRWPCIKYVGMVLHEEEDVSSAEYLVLDTILLNKRKETARNGALPG